MFFVFLANSFSNFFFLSSIPNVLVPARIKFAVVLCLGSDFLIIPDLPGSGFTEDILVRILSPSAASPSGAPAFEAVLTARYSSQIFCLPRIGLQMKH